MPLEASQRSIRSWRSWLAGGSSKSLLRSPYVWLFVFALGFRLIYVAQSVGNPLFGVPLVDAQMYDDWAASMAQGNWLWERLPHYLPIYPFFLAILKVLFGPNPMAVKCVQSLLGALGCVLLGLIASRVWSRRAGWIAGFLASTYWLSVVYESEEFAEPFSIFFQGLTLYLLICRGAGPVPCLLAGLAFGLSSGARANLLLVFPAVVGWLVWRHWRHWRLSALAVLAFALGVGAVLGPIVARNRWLSGAWLLRAQGAWTLYCGLEPRFEGLPIPPGVQFDNFMRQPIRAGLRDRADIERFWAEKARRTVAEHPLEVARNLARRLVMLLNAREFSQEIDVYAYRRYSWFLSLPWPGFWLVGPLGLFGVFLRRPRSKERALLLLYLGVGFVSILPAQLADRYRLPTASLLTLFAGSAIDRLIEWGRKADWRRLGAAAGALGALCVLSWPDWMNLRQRSIARDPFWIGLHMQHIGRIDEAVAAFEQSMREYSWDADSPYRIGLIRVEQGRIDEALSMFREALAREGEFPEVLAAMGRIEFQRGHLEEAEKRARESLRLYPNYEAALVLMARIRAQQDRFDEEIQLYEQALREGAGADIVINLALRLEELGRFEEALGWHEALIESPKAEAFERARAATWAGYLAARRLGDLERAKAYWSLVLARWPNESFFANQAAFLLGRIDEGECRRRCESSPSSAEREFAEYAIGLSRRLAGDAEGAAAAFRRCLELAPSEQRPPKTLPQKWAWEELERLSAAE